MLWYTETLHPRWRQTLLVKEVLYHSNTGLQEIVVFEHEDWGRVLVLDGALQLTTEDEFVYHEMLAHVPIIAHGRARHVCVVGGGDGGTLREVARHRSVERITHVEIDPGVIEFCRKYFPELSGGAFEDPRYELVVADGARYMAREGPAFDVIIVDSTDPQGPGAVLFTEQFYAACRRRLAPGGILVTQTGNPAIEKGELIDTQRNKHRAGFRDVFFYVCAVPTYIGGFMSLGWATDEPAYRQLELATIRERFAASGIGGLRYYTPEIHWASFRPPPHLVELAAKATAGEAGSNA